MSSCIRTSWCTRLYPASVTVQNQLHALQQYLLHPGLWPGGRDAQSLRADRRPGLAGQALLWSYVDDFRYMALVCFACIPIVFMLKKAVSPARRAAAWGIEAGNVCHRECDMGLRYP